MKKTMKENPHLTTIGNNIRYERRKRKLTLNNLADYVGMAPGFLGLIERGERGASIPNLCTIADFFEVDLESLIRKDLQKLDYGVIEKKEYTPRDRKMKSFQSMLSSFDDEELDYFITIMKAYKKLNPEL